MATKGQISESPTLTCVHCGTPMPFDVKERGTLAKCLKCDGYVCRNPLCLTYCRPWQKVLDDAIERAERASSSTNLGLIIPSKE